MMEKDPFEYFKRLVAISKVSNSHLPVLNTYINRLVVDQGMRYKEIQQASGLNEAEFDELMERMEAAATC